MTTNHFCSCRTTKIIKFCNFLQIFKAITIPQFYSNCVNKKARDSLYPVQNQFPYKV